MKISWWDWLPLRPWRIIGTVEAADEIPDRLPNKAIVMVVSAGRPKWLSFDCPCHTGHRILLNIDQGRRPAWSLSGYPRRPLSISPSIDYMDDQKRCHYFLRNGQIQWAKDSRR